MTPAHRNRLEKLKKLVDENPLTKIKSYEKRLEKIHDVFEQLDKLIQEASDPEDGIKTWTDLQRKEVSQQIQKFKDYIEKSTSEAKEVLSSIYNEEDGLEKLNVKARDDYLKVATKLMSIEKNFQDSKKYLENIRENSIIAADTTYSSEFGKRKMELEKSSRFWLISIIVSLVGLFIFQFLIFFNQQDNIKNFEAASLWLIKISMSVPFVAFFIFAVKNYSDTRRYIEKYAFKYVKGAAIRNYIKLLNDEYADLDRDQLLDFTIESFNSIFKEPYQDIKNNKLKFSFDGEAKSMIAEIAEELDIPESKVRSKLKTLVKNNLNEDEE